VKNLRSEQSLGPIRTFRTKTSRILRPLTPSLFIEELEMPSFRLSNPF